jgi:XTP/dITP diphosphohydrolase
MKLVLATRNAHKLEEIKAIFGLFPDPVQSGSGRDVPHSREEGRPPLEVLSAFDFPDAPDVVEDKDTFEGNAVKKAVEIAKATGCMAMADDSGLEVDALSGAPGVYSARYAGEPCNYDANNAKLLKELEGVKNRTARFRTVIALAQPDGTVKTVAGSCEGTIIEERRGTHGFGYDPLFVPDGYTETFAELSPDVKNRISHRARALHKARDAWAELLSQ